eukprot:SAG22_NODE_618_length_8527_cov_6.070123_2_plen_263_part_00
MAARAVAAAASPAGHRRIGKLTGALGGGCGRNPALAGTRLFPATAAADAGGAEPVYDLCIRGAKTYEAAGHPAGAVLDVATKDGKIAAVEPAGTIPAGSAKQEVDGANLLLTPGLIDYHTHIFKGVTDLGLDPDDWCLARGTTTAVDAGSAGCNTVDGFVKYIDGRYRTRCLALINIAMHGLAAGGGGAYAHANQLQVEPAVVASERHPEHVVGVKVLLTASYANGGANEHVALERGLALVRQHTTAVLLVPRSCVFCARCL